MILKAGKNCWRKSHASHTRLLIDGQSYFSEFRKAVISARRRVLIAGWDIDSRMDLLRSDTDDGYPHRLGEFFLHVLKKNKRLHIYILLWDFAMIYALDRDWAPVLNHANWRRHKRMHLVMDGQHRKGASHHQKIVTIDESLAFLGGFDLSKERWDTPEHKINDQRRVDGAGNSYTPFHDMQLMMDGQVVKDINDLLAERWLQATGKSLPGISLPTEDTYFQGDEKLLFKDISLAIARTYYHPGDDQDFHETKQMHIDAIRSAQELIYIENQYLSSSAIGEELVKKLEQADGPEMIIVLPRECSGWLEKRTMDVLRARIMSLLKKADKSSRLRIYYPKIDAEDKQVITVHAKLLIVDDKILKVGSSNLSNRSMALDSESDIVITADSQQHVRETIRAVRHQLLCEHCAADVREFARAEKESGSMIKAIEQNSNNDQRRLMPLKEQNADQLIADIDTIKIADPEHPVDPEHLINHFIGDTAKREHSKNIKKFLVIIAGLALIAILWTLTPVADWMDKETMASVLNFWNETHPVLGKFYFVIAFAVLAVLGVPVTVLIGSAGILYGSLLGSALTLSACLLSALGSYGIGHFTGKDFIRNLSGDKINAVGKRLSQRGIWTIIFVRIVPVAPYAVINMLAGASRIRLRDFTAGTLIGMLPGTLLLTTFFSQFIDFIRDTEISSNSIWPAAGWILLILAIVVMIFFIIRKNRK